MHPSVNVLGTDLEPCSEDPLTGWYRDGCCNTDDNDRGSHTVCCVLTDDFLQFAKEMGNDLITPAPRFNFPGLKAEFLMRLRQNMVVGGQRWNGLPC